MNKLWVLVKKDVRLIWRSKIYMLALFGVPFIFAVMLGSAFNNSDPYSIVIGVYSNDYGSDKTSVIEALGKDFTVLRWHSEQSCVDAMKRNVVHTCMILPEKFDFYGDDVNQIVFYVDGSRVNLVWMILNVLDSRLRIFSSDLSLGFAQNFMVVLAGLKDSYDALQGHLLTADARAGSILERIGELGALLGTESAQNVQRVLGEALQEQGSIQTSLNSVYAQLSTHIGEEQQRTDELQEQIDALGVSNSSKEELNDKIGEIEKALTASKERLAELNAAIVGLSGLGEKQKEAEMQSIEVMSVLQEARMLQKDALSGMNDMDGVLDIMNGSMAENEHLFSLIQVRNASKVAMPFVTEVRSIAVLGSYLSYLFPTLLMMLSAFGAIFLSSSMIVLEKKSRARLRNYFTPTSFFTFFSAHIISVLLVLLPAVFAFVVLSIFFGVQIHFLIFFILFLVAFLFVLMGMCIGYISKSEQGNALLNVVFASILVFFSNTIIPIESTSGIVEKIIRYNPLVVGEVILRKVLLYDVQISMLLADLSLLLLFVLIFGVVAFSFSLITRRRES